MIFSWALAAPEGEKCRNVDNLPLSAPQTRALLCFLPGDKGDLPVAEKSDAAI